MYSPADGTETEGVASLLSDDLHHGHGAVWFLGLRETSGNETERAHAAGGCRTIHPARTWCHTSCSRRVLQWLGHGCDADDDRRGRTVVGHGALNSGGVSFHVRDRRWAVDHAAAR